MQNYIEIFLIGLFGSMQCIGMCGGFVGMYSLRRPADMPALPYHLLYSLGRITTYSLLGGILGRIGSFAAYAAHQQGIPGLVLMLAGLLMIVMGLNAAGMNGKMGFLEDSGVTGTSFFRKALHLVLSLRTPWGTFLLGLLLGLLPCGLLYPVLVHAALSSGFLPGALTMAALFDPNIGPAYRMDIIDDMKMDNGSNSIKTKTIKVKVIKLKDFISLNNIPYISYFHCDTQGFDLKVLKGMEDSISLIQMGVVESANKENILYNDQNSVKDTVEYLEYNNFEILEIEQNDAWSNEVNIFFKNKNK